MAAQVSKNILIKKYREFEKFYFETKSYDKAIEPLINYLLKKGVEVTK